MKKFYNIKNLENLEDSCLELKCSSSLFRKLVNENNILKQRIYNVIQYCEESSKTIKSEYFSDVLKILKGEENEK